MPPFLLCFQDYSTLSARASHVLFLLLQLGGKALAICLSVHIRLSTLRHRWGGPPCAPQAMPMNCTAPRPTFMPAIPTCNFRARARPCPLGPPRNSLDSCLDMHAHERIAQGPSTHCSPNGSDVSICWGRCRAATRAKARAKVLRYAFCCWCCCTLESTAPT